jgi:excisionase family DNA binding protein
MVMITSKPLEPVVYTIPEVAAILKCHRNTVERLIRGKQLPAIRLGSKYRVRAEALEAFLRDQEGRHVVTTVLSRNARRSLAEASA